MTMLNVNVNGNSAYKPNGDGRDLPWPMRMAMPVPRTNVSGL
jgi:hypothetical protein